MRQVELAESEPSRTVGRTIKLFLDMIDVLLTHGWRFVSRKDGVDTSMAIGCMQKVSVSHVQNATWALYANIHRQGRCNCQCRAQYKVPRRYVITSCC